MSSGSDPLQAAILIVVLLFGGGLAFAKCTANATGANYEAAQPEAERFAKNIYKDKLRTLSCARSDTDHDGYVSCTISYEEGGATKIEAIECAVAMTFNEGCRIQRASLRQR